MSKRRRTGHATGADSEGHEVESGASEWGVTRLAGMSINLRSSGHGYGHGVVRPVDDSLGQESVTAASTNVSCTEVVLSKTVSVRPIRVPLETPTGGWGHVAKIASSSLIGPW
jgi:hypothetical protein